MKKTIYFLLVVLFIGLFVFLDFSPDIISENTISSHQGQCSVITCTVGEEILWGYNFEGHAYLEPFIQFGDHITFEDGGVSYFGKNICATGRMSEDGPRDRYAILTNDGLCIAYNSLPAITMFIDPLKENYSDENFGLINECSAVQEVISFYNKYNYITPNQTQEWTWQSHMADADGNATIIGLNEFGRVTMTEMNESHFLISTNINAANLNCYEDPKSDSIGRINIAAPMLQTIVANESLTVNAFRDVLKAISREIATHSLIFNPKTLDIYVYYRNYYDKVFNFNIEEEFNKLAPGEVKFYNLKEMYYSTFTNTSAIQVPITSIIIGLFSLFIIITKLKKK